MTCLQPHSDWPPQAHRRQVHTQQPELHDQSHSYCSLDASDQHLEWSGRLTSTCSLTMYRLIVLFPTFSHVDASPPQTFDVLPQWKNLERIVGSLWRLLFWFKRLLSGLPLDSVHRFSHLSTVSGKFFSCETQMLLEILDPVLSLMHFTSENVLPEL